MSSFPNTLKVNESVLDDFPEELSNVPSPRPVAPPPPVFLEPSYSASPVIPAAIQAAQPGTTETRPVRRGGFLAAALIGVGAGAIGGLIIFGQGQPSSIRQVERPASIKALAEPPPQPAAPAAQPPAVSTVQPSAAAAISGTIDPPAAAPARPALAAALPPVPAPSRDAVPTQSPALTREAAVAKTAPEITGPAPLPAPRAEAPVAVAAVAPPVAAAVPAEPPPAALDALAPVAAASRVDVSRAAPVPSVPAKVDEEAAIGAVLDRYQTAYGKRDAAAVKQIWPSANQAALAKAFANLESQNLAFYSCKTTIEGPTARTSCGGQMSYVARVGNGSSRTQHRDWTFTLSRRATDDWQIDGVVIR